MDQRIPEAVQRMLIPIVGADAVAARRKRHFHQVHKTATDDFGIATVGPAADQSPARPGQHVPVGSLEVVAVG